MKRLFTIIALSLTGFIQAQSDTIKYDSTMSLSYCSNISNWTSFGAYVSKDGSILRIGDTLKIGEPSTNTNQFTYLYLGFYNIGKAIMSTNYPLNGNFRSEKVTISEIRACHKKMSKNSELQIVLYVRNPSLGNMVNKRTVTSYEAAIELKEIINPNAALTREQAISKLKEAKDLVDLGMMTESEYNELKEKLKPIITNH